MKTFRAKTILWATAFLMIIMVIGLGCKKTYFRIREEAQSKQTVKFSQSESYYQMGKTIALTQGKFELRPGDSTVLYIVGTASVSGIGEAGVATLDFKETARFYFMLPTFVKVGSYDVGYKSICEIIGSPKYGYSENLFTCQTGRVVVDSIKGSKLYGQFGGKFINTRNNTLTVEGDFRSKQK